MTIKENCNDDETHPAWFVDLLLVVHDSILPGQVQELQDDGQPSGQKE